METAVEIHVEEKIIFPFGVTISWLQVTFKLCHDYANWSIHELICKVWFSITLNNQTARYKTNWTKNVYSALSLTLNFQPPSFFLTLKLCIVMWWVLLFLILTFRIVEYLFYCLLLLKYCVEWVKAQRDCWTHAKLLKTKRIWLQMKAQTERRSQRR